MTARSALNSGYVRCPDFAQTTMADLASTQSSPSPATDVDGNLLLSGEDAQALLR